MRTLSLKRYAEEIAKKYNILRPRTHLQNLKLLAIVQRIGYIREFSSNVSILTSKGANGVSSTIQMQIVAVNWRYRGKVETILMIHGDPILVPRNNLWSSCIIKDRF